MEKYYFEILCSLLNILDELCVYCDYCHQSVALCNTTVLFTGNLMKLSIQRDYKSDGVSEFATKWIWGQDWTTVCTVCTYNTEIS